MRYLLETPLLAGLQMYSLLSRVRAIKTNAAGARRVA